MGVRLLVFVLKQTLIGWGRNSGFLIFMAGQTLWEMETVAKRGENTSKSDLFIFSL